MHVMANPTFRCQLKCAYCLIPDIKVNRDIAIEHTWDEWAAALIRHVPAGSIVDVAGGDPLLFEGLAYMLKELGEHGIQWAITTNGMGTEGTDLLLEVRPRGCVLINVSDHEGNAKNGYNVDRLAQVFPLVFNRVAHPRAGRNRSRIASVIPYQSWKEGTELDGIPRWCDSGARHWIADPGGNVFRCNPAMATAQTPIGNLFLDNIVTPEPVICLSGCSTCYTSCPGAWQVDMREVRV